MYTSLTDQVLHSPKQWHCDGNSDLALWHITCVATTLAKTWRRRPIPFHISNRCSPEILITCVMVQSASVITTQAACDSHTPASHGASQSVLRGTAKDLINLIRCVSERSQSEKCVKREFPATCECLCRSVALSPRRCVYLHISSTNAVHKMSLPELQINSYFMPFHLCRKYNLPHYITNGKRLPHITFVANAQCSVDNGWLTAHANVATK